MGFVLGRHIGYLRCNKDWLKALELEMKHLSNPDAFKGSIRYTKLTVLKGGASDEDFKP